MTNVAVRQAITEADLTAVRELCWSYHGFLKDYSEEWKALISKTYPVQSYRELLEKLPVIHARPRGIILLAESEGSPVGCGMVQPVNATDAEIKRVFVKSEFRGSGAGKTISLALVEQARRDGYRRVVLDTSRQFSGAQKLYESLGFRRCDSYAESQKDIEEFLVFYELNL